MFVLIGGGDLKNKTTNLIDEFIVKKTNKKCPNVLFIPTAMQDSKKSIDNFKIAYQDLSKIDLLLLYDDISKEEMIKKVLNADIIYVGGGNTSRMLNKWRETGFDEIIKTVIEKKIIVGISAGAICWFDEYLGDSEAFFDNGYCNFRLHKGLGIIKGICCPHYDEEGKDVFNDIMKTKNTIGYAIENNCALVIENKKYYTVKANKRSSVYKFLTDNFIMKEI